MLNEAKQPLEERYEHVYFVNLKDGTAIVTEDGEKKNYGSVSGHLEQIQLTEREFNGVRQKYWYVKLSDGDELYNIGFYYNNGAFKSVVMNLYGNDVRTSDTIEIRPYVKSGYTNVSVKKNGEVLKWGEGVTMPPVERVTVNGIEQSDSTKRMLFIEGLATEINALLKSN